MEYRPSANLCQVLLATTCSQLLIYCNFLWDDVATASGLVICHQTSPVNSYDLHGWLTVSLLCFYMLLGPSYKHAYIFVPQNLIN